MPWITDLVAAERDVGQWSSMAIGSDSLLHISFYDATRGNLMYARQQPREAWALTTIASGGDVGEYNALALSSSNEPRVAYFDRGRHSIGYAVYSSDTGWSINDVRDQRQAASTGPPCLALTRRDRARILAPNQNVLIRMVEQDAGGTFNFFGNISANAFDGSAALVLDEDGNWHVVYNDICPFLDCDPGEISEWIVYATNAPGGPNRPLYFEKTAILHVPGGAAANRIRQPALAIDNRGRVHFVYVDQEDSVLKYLANEGDWAQQVLYDATSVCGASMWMGTAGYLHVAFTAGGLNTVGTHLMYATNASGDWVTETVDGSSEIGWVTSIVVDRFAQPHISYYDATHGNLRHAVRVLGTVEHVR